MIQIRQIKLRPGEGHEKLKSKAAGILGCVPENIKDLKIVRESIDARKKPDIFFVYEVLVSLKNCHNKKQEEAYIKRHYIRHAEVVIPSTYQFPFAVTEPKSRPVVVGMGPAGLFCGLMLARAGYAPIIIERGKPVDEREKDVKSFWDGGSLNPESNVQFGEGGAGTFSDGKLNTLVKGSKDIHRFILEELVRFGAPEKIIYSSKPHIGTDILRTVVKNIREEILALGGEIFFNCKMENLIIEGGRLKGIVCLKEGVRETIFCDKVCLAIGHSARDTFRILGNLPVLMEPKPFALGVRMEHPQRMIDEAQYGADADMAWLSPAAYKLTAKAQNGRSVYSFCMCPGGYVVNASSEQGRLVVNGMSYSKRDARNANSAIVVGVSSLDFRDKSIFCGMHFQQTLEERAYKLAGGAVPLQTYGDFKENIKSTSRGDVNPNVMGKWGYANLRDIFPEFINEALISAIQQFGKKLKGFDRQDALMLGVESRTSSPIRILRDETLQSSIRGLYPCGEGAGYAGGITSAAIDGVRVAEAMAKSG